MPLVLFIHIIHKAAKNRRTDCEGGKQTWGAQQVLLQRSQTHVLIHRLFIAKNARIHGLAQNSFKFDGLGRDADLFHAFMTW